MKKVIEILKDINSEIDFENTSNLVGGGMLGSIDILNIITEIEEEYGIEISPTEIVIENFQSLDAIEALIKKHV